MGPGYDHSVSLVLRLREDPAGHHGPGRLGRWAAPGRRHGQHTPPRRTATAPRKARWPLLQPFLIVPQGG